MCYSNSLGSKIFNCRQLKVKKKREGRLWILFVWMFQLKCWKISRSFWCFLHVMVSSWSWSVLLETFGFTVTYIQNIHHADTSTESERCAELYGGYPPHLWWSSLCMDFKVVIASPTGLSVTTSSLLHDCLLFFIFTSLTKIDNNESDFVSQATCKKPKQKDEMNVTARKWHSTWVFQKTQNMVKSMKSGCLFGIWSRTCDLKSIFTSRNVWSIKI